MKLFNITDIISGITERARKSQIKEDKEVTRAILKTYAEGTQTVRMFYMDANYCFLKRPRIQKLFKRLGFDVEIDTETKTAFLSLSDKTIEEYNKCITR